MMKSTVRHCGFTLTFLSLCASGSVLKADNLQENMDDATAIIRSFNKLPEGKTIPAEIIQNAKGIAILNVIKVGFAFSGEGGSGVLIVRSEKGWNGWSAPSGISMGGVGWGLQWGGQNTEFVMILNTQGAVDAFASSTNVKLGVELSVAAGPVGRNLNGSIVPTAAIYSYSRCEGLFAGVSVAGTVLAVEKQTNNKFYHQPITSPELLFSGFPVPLVAHPLIDALNEFAVPSAAPTPSRESAPSAKRLPLGS